ncbi:Calcium/proton exchanger [Xylaria nigripes]|nr:Calcium/proton exchanger [Xylaria nigripes]
MMAQPEERLNLIEIKWKAHRYGRTADGLKYAWLNPFHRFEYKTPSRANTYHVTETGAVVPNGSATILQHAETAPGNIQTQVDQHSLPNAGLSSPAEAEEIFDLQATAASSDGLQIRRRVTTSLGDAQSRKDSPPPADDDDAEIPKGDFTLKNQIQRTIFSSPVNVLLLAAPAGIALWALKIPGPAVFVVNFVAIIPLATLLSDATEQVALRTGETIGGLINATFGNAVELIVAIIALTQNEVTVVKTSLIGSVLSNLLLVLGCCFLGGGFNRTEQYFNTTVAQTAASLLALSVASLIVPTIFSHTPDFYTNDIVTSLPSSAVPELSHGVAIILLLTYFSYLFFQLKTHTEIFNEESQKVPKKEVFKKDIFKNDLFKRRPSIPEGAIASGVARLGAAHAGIPSEDGLVSEIMQVPSEGPEEPTLHLYVALASLTISTVIIALCAEGLVSGIQSITSAVSEEFIGLILIPIVGNACEHATAVTVAMKDKMDLAIGVAIGSSMQVSLFLIPLLVIIGWGIGNDDMTLAFDTFQIVTLFVAVLLVNYLIGDGKSHWLEGVQLIALYVIIAVCAFYYPNGTGIAANGAAVAI